MRDFFGVRINSDFIFVHNKADWDAETGPPSLSSLSGHVTTHGMRVMQEVSELVKSVRYLHPLFPIAPPGAYHDECG